MDDALIADAAAACRRGGVIVLPTETVYGLAGRPTDDVVERMHEIKGRDATKSFQVLVEDAAWLDRYATVPDGARRLAAAFWPGPLTLVVAANASAPQACVRDGSIGLRVPAHPVALDLLSRTGPLAATSANPSGEPTSADLAAIRAVFGDAIDVYLDGGRIEGAGSTVVDVTARHPTVLREGGVSTDDVHRVFTGST